MSLIEFPWALLMTLTFQGWARFQVVEQEKGGVTSLPLPEAELPKYWDQRVPRDRRGALRGRPVPGQFQATEIGLLSNETGGSLVSLPNF